MACSVVVAPILIYITICITGIISQMTHDAFFSLDLTYYQIIWHLQRFTDLQCNGDAGEERQANKIYYNDNITPPEYLLNLQFLFMYFVL